MHIHQCFVLTGIVILIEIPIQKPYHEIEVLIIDSQSVVHTVVRAALLDAGLKNMKVLMTLMLY